jgi:sigma-B regulation protein RsbU (phosphoserine phosphatase)
MTTPTRLPTEVQLPPPPPDAPPRDGLQVMALVTILLQAFFSNLGVKLILLIIAIQTVVVMSLVTVVVNHQRQEALTQLQGELRFRAKAINLGLITETDLYNGPKLTHLVSEVSQLPNVLTLRLVNREYVVIASTDAGEIDQTTDPADPEAIAPLRELKTVLETREPLSVEEHGKKGHTLRMIAPMIVLDQPAAVAEIEFSLASLDQKLALLRTQALLIGILLVTLISVGLIIGLNRMVIAPLRRLTATTQQIAAGTYAPRGVKADGTTDEVGKLYLAIDQMAAELQEQQQQLLEQQRYRQELEMGTQIQQSMLPQTPPVIEGVDIAFYLKPADEVGGDYYDLVPLDEKRLAVAIGDVNGHGLGAALLMAMAKSAFHMQVGRDPDATTVITGLNEMVFSATAERRFMTFFYALIDLQERRIHYTNAGHHYPYQLQARDGRLISLKPSAYPLGVRPNTQFPVREGSIGPGDVLVFYTDGIIEAKNPQGEEFGFERLEELIWLHQRQTAEKLREAILTSLREFQAGQSQDDDVTLMVLKLEV